jgi:hypothetical protein
MERQRKQSQEASKFGVDLRSGVTVEGKTNFSGYDHLAGHGHDRHDPEEQGARDHAAPGRRKGRWFSITRLSMRRAAARSATPARSSQGAARFE